MEPRWGPSTEDDESPSWRDAWAGVEPGECVLADGISAYWDGHDLFATIEDERCRWDGDSLTWLPLVRETDLGAVDLSGAPPPPPYVRPSEPEPPPRLLRDLKLHFVAEVAPLDAYLAGKNERQVKEVLDELKTWKAFGGDRVMSDSEAFGQVVDALPGRVEEYLAHERARGLSKATINNKRSRLRRMKEHASSSGPLIPAVQAQKKEPEPRQVQPISPTTELVVSIKETTSPTIGAGLDLQARQLMTDWLASPQFKPGTVRAYAGAVIALQEYCKADAPEVAIAQLLTRGQELFDEFRIDQVQRYAPKTVRQRMCALASLVRAARERGLTDVSVTTSWRHVRPVKDMSGPPRGELQKCIDALQHRAEYPRRRVASIRDVAILELASRAGLRASEIAGLELRHVDLEHGEVWPQRKRRQVREAVPVSGPALDALREYVAVRGDRPGPLWLLANARGALSTEPMNEHRMRDMVRGLGLHRVGDPSRIVGIHGLRHLAAQEAYIAGGIEAAAEVLGHRDRHYESTDDYLWGLK